jgi:hypothetical protein
MCFAQLTWSCDVTERRFPPPWTAELFHRACANGQAFSNIYYESEPGRSLSGQAAQQR